MASTTLTNQWASLTVGDYSVLNNDWGISASQSSVAYTSIAVANTASVNTGLTMSWVTPDVIPPSYVYAYPEVYWGTQYGKFSPTYSTTVGNISNLLVNYSTSISSTANADVMLEVWLTNAAGTITHEVAVKVAGWSDGNTTPYQDQYITALTNLNAPGAGGSWNFISYRTSSDMLSGTISFSNILKSLVAQGIVSSTDIISGVELGSEMRSGSGTLQVNNFNVYEALTQPNTIIETATSPSQTFDISTNDNYTITGSNGNLVRFEFPQSNYTITTTASGLLVVDKTSGSVVNLNGISASQLQFPSSSLFSTSPSTPAAPTVTESLTSDTGSSATDHITSNPALTGTADANATIHFNVDGTNISATATANASGVWTFADTGLVNGNHTVIASETNASGLTGTASLSFALDTTAPVVTESLLNIAASSTPPSLTAIPTLTGTGDANTLVTIKDGASVLGTATSNASGAWSYTPSTLANGLHTLTAQETDAAGNTGTASVALNLNVTSTPTPTSSAATVTGSVGSDWGTGFIENISIGGGSKGIASGWTLNFDSTANVTNIWGASIVSHIGNHYVLQNVSYDAQVAAGGVTLVGFQATHGIAGDGVTNLHIQAA